MTSLVMAALLFAQDQTVFRVTAPLVMVPATVTDKQGKTIEGLNESDFILLDNGVPQKHVLEDSLSPISLVLVIEANSRSGAVLRKVQKIGSIIQPIVLGEHGSAAVVTFADEVKVWQDFTTRADILGNCLKKIEPQGGGVRLHDAVSKAVDMLVERKNNARRRAIIVISESKDHDSKTKLADLVTKTEEANVIVYAVSYSVMATAFTSRGGETFASGTPVYDADSGGLIAIFKELAAASKESSHSAFAKYTGGQQVNFTSLNGLEKVVAKIGEDLHSQYLLSFAPTHPKSATPEFRKLEVQVKDHPEALIRTRPGYWPSE